LSLELFEIICVSRTTCWDDTYIIYSFMILRCCLRYFFLFHL